MSEIYFSIACYRAAETAVAYLLPTSYFPLSLLVFRNQIKIERAKSYKNNESPECIHDLYHILFELENGVDFMVFIDFELIQRN